MTAFRNTGYVALRVLSGPWLRLTRRRNGLRILAYHDIPDGETFRRHLAYLVRHYSPIASVAEMGTTEKPPVWVTFDDGDPSIVEVGLAALREFDVKATAFVCPDVIDTDEPFWWQVVEAAIAEGVPVDGSPIPADEVALLKKVPDQQRRNRVDEICRSIEEHTGARLGSRQLTTEELQMWLAEGHSVGNHTWDHPILSMCPPQEQRRQVESAHRWFVDNDMPTRLFAYPNGDRTPSSERALGHAGYSIGLLFDHRVAAAPFDLATSRIRVNGNDQLNEFAAKVSGLHPALYERMGT